MFIDSICPSSSTKSTSFKSDFNQRPVLGITYHPHNIPLKMLSWKTFTSSNQTLNSKSYFLTLPLWHIEGIQTSETFLCTPLLSLTPNNTNQGTHPCGKDKCKMCDRISPATIITGPKTTFTVNRHFTCDSENVFYAIIYSLCNSQTMTLYIGETSRPLTARAEQLRSARLVYDNPVVQHFQQPAA